MKVYPEILKGGRMKKKRMQERNQMSCWPLSLLPREHGGMPFLVIILKSFDSAYMPFCATASYLRLYSKFAEEEFYMPQ